MSLPKDDSRPSLRDTDKQLLHTRKSAALRLFGDPRKTETIRALEAAGKLTAIKFGGKMSVAYIRDDELVALANNNNS